MQMMKRNRIAMGLVTSLATWLIVSVPGAVAAGAAPTAPRRRQLRDGFDFAPLAAGQSIRQFGQQCLGCALATLGILGFIQCLPGFESVLVAQIAHDTLGLLLGLPQLGHHAVQGVPVFSLDVGRPAISQNLHLQ